MAALALAATVASALALFAGLRGCPLVVAALAEVVVTAETGRSGAGVDVVGFGPSLGKGFFERFDFGCAVCCDGVPAAVDSEDAGAAGVGEDFGAMLVLAAGCGACLAGATALFAGVVSLVSSSHRRSPAN